MLISTSQGDVRLASPQCAAIQDGFPSRPCRHCRATIITSGAASEVDHGHGHGEEPLRDAKGRVIVEMYDSKGR